LEKNERGTKMKTKTKRNFNLIVCIGLSISLLVSGCDSSAKTDALIGTGVGALIGQAVGGDTGATLIGAGVGAGAGYLIGNHQDKKAAEKHDYSTPTPLSGTQWSLSDLTMENKPQYQSYTLEFTKDGKIVTTLVKPDGTKKIDEEKYRIVDDTIVVHKDDYIINAKYALYGNELQITTDKFKAVLKKI
jgi:uncharacterized protein YcfJ